MTIETNDVDDLMDKDPLLLTEQDLRSLVIYYRQSRAKFEAGIKPKKEKGPDIKIDLAEALGFVKPQPKITRRV